MTDRLFVRVQIVRDDGTVVLEAVGDAFQSLTYTTDLLQPVIVRQGQALRKFYGFTITPTVANVEEVPDPQEPPR